jgi:small-conductance mechanosensitive channel/CRP-like cAMP-binding protein
MIVIGLLLAQATTTPATASGIATTRSAFDYGLWVPQMGELVHAGIVGGSTLVLGLVILGIVRKQVRHLKLTTAFGVAIAAMTVWVALWAYKPGQMNDAADPIAVWVHRAFAAAMVFVALRVVDRLAIVPLLTRGGRVAMPRLFHQIVNILLALFAILIYGSKVFGWDINGFLAGSAVVSIVLGLALQETLGNFFSGLVMQASPPFAIGDWIICGAHEGRVVDVTWRAVTIHTPEDNFILIPNGTVAKAEIVNYHAPTTATARSIEVGLDYDVPPCDAIAVLELATRETPGVIAKPAPVALLKDFTDAAVLYRVKFWIDAPARHVAIEHAVRVNVWYRLHGRGYGIPFPTYNIEHISTQEKQQKSAEKARGHRIRALDAVPLFAPLSRDQKRDLSDSADDWVLAPGQVLFKQNDTGSDFYIISQGQVDVLVTPESGGEERKVATLGPGDFFGEMSALTGQPRTATIRAATPIGLVRIEKEDLQGIFEQDPSIMEKISEIVARRNVEREAIKQKAGAESAEDKVNTQKKTLLGRMMSFFRIGKAA